MNIRATAQPRLPFYSTPFLYICPMRNSNRIRFSIQPFSVQYTFVEMRASIVPKLFEFLSTKIKELQYSRKESKIKELQQKTTTNTLFYSLCMGT